MQQSRVYPCFVRFKGNKTIEYIIKNGLIIIIFALIILVGVIIALRTGSRFIETPEKRAGRMGEKVAASLIKEVLTDDDTLLNNVHIIADGLETELDNLIINSYGVFIIEVKNYSGQLLGEEKDKDWLKIKTTPGGNSYSKTVRNPIGQVKRQEYILSRYLKQNGIHEWVKGYVFFVEMNSPVKSAYVLDTRKDIDRAIHTLSDERGFIDEYMREKIKNIL